MTTEPQKISLENIDDFSQLKFFILTSLIFLDFGILFGALNSLRVAGIFNFGEIHQTHWTSTLFGAMLLLMIAQIYFMLTKIAVPRKTINQLGIAVLILTLVGIFSSYTSVWLQPQPFDQIFIFSIKAAVILYNIILFYSLLNSDIMTRMSLFPSSYMLLAAVAWLDISVLIFFGFEGVYIPPIFLVAFIYGFFSHTLFGTLNFVLPVMFDQKVRAKGSIVRDTIMLSTASVLLLIREYIGTDAPQVLGLLGPVIWGLVGFFFILYVFDLIYKTGFSPSLVGLIAALIMFGFFVFDTFMKNIFPQWVAASHVHFMFLGTLVLTIVSIGSRIIISQQGKDDKNLLNSSNLRVVSIGLSLTFVVLILFMFTFSLYELAGYMGLGLFGSILVMEYTMLTELRTT